MGDANHRDDTRRGPRAAGQALNLPRVVHAHLNNSVLSIVVQTEQRVGHADVIVLVALGFQRIAEGGQHGIAELLGGGLATLPVTPIILGLNSIR